MPPRTAPIRGNPTQRGRGGEPGRGGRGGRGGGRGGLEVAVEVLRLFPVPLLHTKSQSPHLLLLLPPRQLVNLPSPLVSIALIFYQV